MSKTVKVFLIFQQSFSAKHGGGIQLSSECLKTCPFNQTKSKLFLLPCFGNVIPINPFRRTHCAVSDTCFAEKIFQHQWTLLKCLTFFQQTFIEKKMTFQHDTCQLQVPLKINEKIYRIQKNCIIVNGRVNNSQNVNSAQWFQQKKVQL